MALKFGNGIDLVNQKIINVADPTNATDAVNKQYADALTRSLSWKASVRAASTAAGTLASDFEPTDMLDGIELVEGDRILLKNQAAGEENGIYVVQASGAPARATDADTALKLKGATVTVQEGTVNEDKVYRLITDNVTLDTTALTWTEIGGGGTSYSADNQGITETGGVFSLALDGSTLSKSGSGLRLAAGIAGAGIVYNSSALDVNVDGTTIEISSDALRIAATAAGSGLSGGGASALSVNTGTASATGLEISSDTVRIAADAAGGGLSGGGGSALSVNTGTASATGLEVSSDTVRIATDAAGAGLTGGGGSALAVGQGSTYSGITVSANDIDINATVVVRKYAVNIGNGSNTSIAVTHNLGTKDITWSVRANSDDSFVLTDGVATNTNTLTLTFATAPTTDQYRVVVHA